MTKISNKWLHHFMKEAFLASEMSKDTTKVGCCIIGEDQEILSKGYNGFPKGVQELEIRKQPEYKQFFTCHAEQNAIDLSKAPLKGAILFTTHEPCAACARSIIQNGIKHVYFATKMEKEHWKTSVQVGRMMLKEANVAVTRLNYTEKYSYVVVESSMTKSLPSNTSIISECRLPTTVQSSTERPEGQITWLSSGQKVAVYEQKDMKLTGTILNTPKQSLNKEKTEENTTFRQDSSEIKE
jgi:dCMP deaminase